MKTAKELALLAARALADKKAKEIQALEIGDHVTVITHAGGLGIPYANVG